MTTLLERRSEFVYNAARLAATAANAPIIPVPWNEREDAFKVQFLKVIERQCGERRSRSPEELHGSWMQSYLAMGWVFGEEYNREAKTHPDLVPYADLGQLERDKDAVFVALCEIARQWVYDAAPAAAMSTGAICRVVLDRIGLRTLYCPTCEGDRGFLLEHYEWYGWNETCLSCGERWKDGEMLERPFERAWRSKNVEAALRRIGIAIALPVKESAQPTTYPGSSALREWADLHGEQGEGS